MRKSVAGRFACSEVEGHAQDGLAVKKRVLQPRRCQSYTRKRFAETLPEIVDRFVQEAKKGSIPHMKILMALSGFDKSLPAEPGGKKRQSLAAVLMKELKRTPNSS